MKVVGEYRFELPKETVWEGLFDPEVLAASLPGCENLERDGDVMRGELVVKIGPVRGKFKGTVEFSDVDAPNRCALKVDGKGTQGFVKATATIELETAEGGTILRYESDSRIGGRIASVGQRLLGASARAITRKSLESLNETLSQLASRKRASALDANDSGAGEEAVAAPLEKKSQAAFAAGVAREIAKDVFPMWTPLLLLLLALAGIGWLIYWLAG